MAGVPAVRARDGVTSLLATLPTVRYGPLLSPRAAVALGALGLVLQVLALLPFVDDNVDTNSTLHYTQHGIIFLGGLLMGIALRDLFVAGRAAERR
jgi:hypothetical protein